MKAPGNPVISKILSRSAGTGQPAPSWNQMKLRREYRLLSASGSTLLVLDCKLFTEKNAQCFYTAYSIKLPYHCPLKLVAVDVLGNYSELNTEVL